MADVPKQPEPGTFRPFPEQNADGVDLSLILENLRLTPTERVRRMDRRVKALRRLRKHVSRIDGK